MPLSKHKITPPKSKITPPKTKESPPKTISISKEKKTCNYTELPSISLSNSANKKKLDYNNKNNKYDRNCRPITYSNMIIEKSNDIIDNNFVISEEQKQIAENLINFNVMVNSVAGSGKTTTCLHISKLHEEDKILILTYNKRLRIDTKTKAEKSKLRNSEVHTYHSFGWKYYGHECKNDEGLKNILSHKSHSFNYDIIIIDEVQDMSLLYFQLVVKILKENKPDAKLCILGDEKQSIYSFNNADIRFITMADQLYNWYNKYEWKKRNLKISYRLTKPMSEFMNNCLFNDNIIISHKDGCKVKYVKCDTYSLSPLIIIKKYLDVGYKNEDIFVLAPSIRSQKTPLRKLQKLLTQKNILVHVPSSDEDKLDDEIIKGKISMCTFHQAKGLERKIAIVFNFDESYFDYYDKTAYKNKCPNALYVACTRGKEHLVLLHHHKKNYLPFINIEELSKCCDIYCDIYCNIVDVKPSNINNKPVSVTDLTRHLPLDVIEKALSYIKIEQIEKPYYKINLTGKVEDNELFESVYDINGVAIPMYYEFITKGCIIMPDNSLYNNDEISIEQLLKLANKACAIRSGYDYKLFQIKKYDWLSKDELEKCMNELNSRVSKSAKYEHKIELNIMEKNICGYIDCIDNNNIWEFKCVDSLDNIHCIQLAIYMNMIELEEKLSSYNFKLFNILTGEIRKITSTNENLNELVKFLIKYKESQKDKIDDDKFLKNIDECVKSMLNKSNIPDTITQYKKNNIDNIDDMFIEDNIDDYKDNII